MISTRNELTRIGVFYDGNYFSHASNFYQYQHERNARISVSGLHSFIRNHVADAESVDSRYCQIVDAHYFRGRPRAQDAEQRGSLVKERQFDDVLVREGVVAHYLPLGPDGEKGIDVWLALEAFELAIHKRFDIVVLVACDGDFLPLVRKLNTLGTRVMLLAWDFKYVDAQNRERETRTAQVLLDEVSYPVMMHQVIDDRSRRTDPLINGLFVAPKEARARPAASSARATGSDAASQQQAGIIQSLKGGFGFITPLAGGPNLFFYHSDLVDSEFDELAVGGKVSFTPGTNDRGACAREIVLSDERAGRVLRP